MNKKTSRELSSLDHFSLLTLQEVINYTNKLHPHEKITANEVLKCAALDLTPLLFSYNGDLHLKTLNDISNSPSVVGSYSYKGILKIEDYKYGLERPFNNFTSHRVTPLKIDSLKPYTGSPLVAETYLDLSHYFSAYLHVSDESDSETPLHYCDGLFLEISELEFDPNGIKFAIDKLKQQNNNRHLSFGRYTAEEAAALIAKATNESGKEIEQMLLSAIKSSSLPAHHPGRSSTIKFQLKQRPYLIYSAEIFWNKLNEWLQENEPEIHFKFPAPALPPERKTLEQGSSDTNSTLTDMPNTHLIHKLNKVHEYKLAVEISAAIERAPSRDSIQSVWNELVKMAEKKEMSLLENCERNEIKYGSPQHPEFFTKKALRSFLDRKKSKAR